MRTTGRRGMVHAHTRLSRDGALSLAELRNVCESAGFSFVCVTDHAEDASPSDFADLVKECDDTSGDEFVAVPGLEFSIAAHTHVLAIGLRYMPERSEPPDVLREVREVGALTVLAHPTATGTKAYLDILNLLDGIEVWNGSHDGGFVPNPERLRIFRELWKRAPYLLAFGGNDFHQRGEMLRMRVTLNSSPAAADGILDALRRGDFTTCGRLWSLGSSITIRPYMEAALGTSYRTYASIKWLRNLYRLWTATSERPK